MFEDELEEDDIGPIDLDDLEELEESDELINDSGFLVEFLKGLKQGRIICFAIKVGRHQSI